ncbi:hypothetical protein LVB87_01285 [Lysobacter sp. KIS68-7]|uniref:hypothetical protein n=1 Tax=Lysobacter sp. KIS68-7 TaxID=2904252 RepID=UPI001E32FA7C|nr:hypothetical protein [Lysobacter sp. KIS68-7]UHQ19828.1 hypothetical protein LVB87_01285 [Lysobacter sp. KIS68-7]
MKRLALCIVLASACVAAFAASQWIDLEQRLTREQMHATGLDTLTAEQLATLNRLLRDDAEATARAQPVAAAPAAAAPEKEGHSNWVGFNDEPIVSQLVGTLTGWEPGTEFVLANGQHWKVLKGHYKLNKPLDNPQVKVVPGAAGRWFFRIDDDTPGARVYRTD